MHNPRLAAAGTALLLVAAGANAQILGSRHDFSTQVFAEGEICKPCHTPHRALRVDAPLWNHNLTSTTYQLHSGTGTAAADIDLYSRVCLSCHDGTVALDSFGGHGGTFRIRDAYRLGTDLRDDHPIGRDAQYPPSPLPPGWSSDFKDPSQLPGAMKLRPWTDPLSVTHNVVGCTTCHEVHNRGNYGHMLQISNAASVLCLSCHIK